MGFVAGIQGAADQVVQRGRGAVDTAQQRITGLVTITELAIAASHRIAGQAERIGAGVTNSAGIGVVAGQVVGGVVASPDRGTGLGRAHLAVITVRSKGKERLSEVRRLLRRRIGQHQLAGHSVAVTHKYGWQGRRHDRLRLAVDGPGNGQRFGDRGAGRPLQEAFQVTIRTLGGGHADGGDRRGGIRITDLGVLRLCVGPNPNIG